MLYLRTGGNGSGKTLLTLKDVRDLQLKTGRPVAHNGRFKIKPEVEAEFGWRKIDFRNWQDEPDGTIFLIDECHYDMPRSGATSKPSAWIEKLTEHRARGFDFFLLTQHPSNMDAFVRRLVQAPGWHQHIKRLGGAMPVANVIQWDAVNLQCEHAGSSKSGEVKTRPYPKEVYQWYDSATIHTGKWRVPKQVLVLVACFVAVPFLFVSLFSQMREGSGKPSPAEQQALETRTAGPRGVSSKSTSQGATVAEYVAAYRPRIDGLLHTAPVYDTLTTPKRVPVPAGCVKSASQGCKCFTQDATPYPTTDAICEQVVTAGIFLAFDPDPAKNKASVPLDQGVPVSASPANAGSR